ncbi:hypothetical protein B0H14DRAFT_3717298 [Mycena olivaceomarginata]|nr:hypothetical protein B0H14DRAFT_3717298 [Mycena olivaceomarginata]
MGVVIEDGWTCFKSDDVFNGIIELRIQYPTHHSLWLSQANYIFHQLHITSNFEDYVPVCDVYFALDVPGTTEEPPAGFLFLCPQKDFKTGPSSYCWPDSPVYWSLNPSGVDQLTLEEATQLRFPTFQCTANIVGCSWDDSVYEGLRKFHRAKGFDSDTQDLARHLGHLLFELSAEWMKATLKGQERNNLRLEKTRTSQTICKLRHQLVKMLVTYPNVTDINTEGSHPEQNDHDSDLVCTDSSSAPNMSSVAEKKPDTGGKVWGTCHNGIRVASNMHLHGTCCALPTDLTDMP